MPERAPNACPLCDQLTIFDGEVSAFWCPSCRSDWLDPVDARARIDARVREARAEAFEEAAQIADEARRIEGGVGGHMVAFNMAVEIAALIRERAEFRARVKEVPRVQ